MALYPLPLKVVVNMAVWFLALLPACWQWFCAFGSFFLSFLPVRLKPWGATATNRTFYRFWLTAFGRLCNSTVSACTSYSSCIYISSQYFGSCRRRVTSVLRCWSYTGSYWFWSWPPGHLQELLVQRYFVPKHQPGYQSTYRQVISFFGNMDWLATCLWPETCGGFVWSKLKMASSMLTKITIFF